MLRCPSVIASLCRTRQHPAERVNSFDIPAALVPALQLVTNVSQISPSKNPQRATDRHAEELRSMPPQQATTSTHPSNNPAPTETQLLGRALRWDELGKSRKIHPSSPGRMHGLLVR